MTNTLFDALFSSLAGQNRPLFLRPGAADISGAAFLATIARAAHALRGMGVQKGDRVAVQIAKSPEALAVYGACVGLGAVFLPLNTGYTADEVDYFIGNATPRVLICDPARVAGLTAAVRRARGHACDP